VTKSDVRSKIAVFVRRILGNFGFSHVNNSDVVTMSLGSKRWEQLSRFIPSRCTQDFKTFLFENIGRSHSQYQQDLIAAHLFLNSSPNYFVEFGASDGIEGSNTLMLEKEFGWSGLLIEPAKIFQARLQENRNVVIDYRCISAESGNIMSFLEQDSLSTLSAYSKSDAHLRNSRINYEVETISLNDVLKQNSSPANISFMSIDTEGSEYDIIKTFDFKKYHVAFFCIEHNNRAEGRELVTFMIENGYSLILEELSEVDYWFLHNDLLKTQNIF